MHRKHFREHCIPRSGDIAIRAFGTPEGSYEIRDVVTAIYKRPTIDAVNLTQNRVSVVGNLSVAPGDISYMLTFEAVSPTHLRDQN